MFANWYAELNLFSLATFLPRPVSDRCKRRMRVGGAALKKTANAQD